MNERFSRFLKHPATIPTVVGVAAFSGGFALGFWRGRQTIQEVVAFEQIELDFDADEIKVGETVQGYMGKDGKFVYTNKEDDPEYQALLREERAIEEAIRNEQRNDPADIEVDEPTLEHIEKIVAAGLTPTHADYDPKNVFAAVSADDNWDYEIELANRTEDKPYVIHRDEFWTNENDWDQSSLTYYSGDDILVDQEETPIYNRDQVVGEMPPKFGHGSGDANCVHIRNPKFMSEYEVLLHDGAYSEVVLGIIAEDEYDPDDIQHSLRKARSRMEREGEE